MPWRTHFENLLGRVSCGPALSMGVPYPDIGFTALLCLLGEQPQEELPETRSISGNGSHLLFRHPGSPSPEVDAGAFCLKKYSVCYCVCRGKAALRPTPTPLWIAVR